MGASSPSPGKADLRFRRIRNVLVATLAVGGSFTQVVAAAARLNDTGGIPGGRAAFTLCHSGADARGGGCKAARAGFWLGALGAVQALLIGAVVGKAGTAH